jgi:hypothetical protein
MRVVNIKLLKDGSGRVCIHWLVQTDKDGVQMPAKTVLTGLGPVTIGGSRGYVACQSRRNDIFPQVQQDGIHVLYSSNDVRAATCPKCLETAEAKALLKELAERVDSAAQANS